MVVWECSTRKKNLFSFGKGITAYAWKGVSLANISVDVILHPYESNTWFLVTSCPYYFEEGFIRFEAYEVNNNKIRHSCSYLVPVGMDDEWNEFVDAWKNQRQQDVSKADAFGTYNVGYVTPKMSSFLNRKSDVSMVVLFDTVNRGFTFQRFYGSSRGFGTMEHSSGVHPAPQCHQIWDHSAFVYDCIPGKRGSSGCVAIYRSPSHDPITVPSAPGLLPKRRNGSLPTHILTGPAGLSQRSGIIVGDEDFIVVLHPDSFTALSFRSVIGTQLVSCGGTK